MNKNNNAPAPQAPEPAEREPEVLWEYRPHGRNRLRFTTTSVPGLFALQEEIKGCWESCRPALHMEYHLLTALLASQARVAELEGLAKGTLNEVERTLRYFSITRNVSPDLHAACDDLRAAVEQAAEENTDEEN